MTEIFTLAVDGDGIATITWDLPGASMNVLSIDGVQQLDALVDQVLADEAVKGTIITSAKPDFAAGRDLSVVASTKRMAIEAGGDPAKGVFDMGMQLHGVLRKIERAGADPKTIKGGKPFVWAAPGTALGIGLEIGLACHQRIAADNPKAKIGLPEILVGIFPGAGGTTRLVRRRGLMGASEALLQGKTYAPKKAKAMMLIDKVVPAEDLQSAAKDWLMNASEKDAVKPWDEKGYKLPGGGP
ncbi:MAG: enoyl-CoA hydratase-related protein, partial [Paracoccaceae bacterium]